MICPDCEAATMVLEVCDVVDRGHHPGDPDAPSHDEEWLRCPSCGFETPDCVEEGTCRPDRGPVPSEDEFDCFADEVMS